MTRSTWTNPLVLLVAFILTASFLLCAEARPLPVLLIYGFQPLPGFRTTPLWENFAEYLTGNSIVNTQTLKISSDHEFYLLPAVDEQRRDVYMSNYCLSYEPTTRDLFFYERRLVDEIKYMATQFDVETFDVVGHSMGGLIARAYAETADFDSVIGTDLFHDYGIAYGGEIRTLVLIATPNHGTSIAEIGDWFNILSRQLTPESEFLSLLNSDRMIDGSLTSLNPSIRYVSLAGQTCLGCGLRADKSNCLEECVRDALVWDGSDLVVMMASAYLPEAENCAIIGFDHVQSHTDVLIAQAVETILNDNYLPVAIYSLKLQSYQPD
ncbi:alpha/beta hydrolase [Candidatus Bipolaricaulota bacterium]|nr:alpha/beta hydrolase [Candidatus Bipolaricaulota bacterium]